jgi:hypothetical protein
LGGEEGERETGTFGITFLNGSDVDVSRR